MMAQTTFVGMKCNTVMDAPQESGGEACAE